MTWSLIGGKGVTCILGYTIYCHLYMVAMEMKNGTDRTWRLLKRRARASAVKSTGSPSQAMKNKGQKNKSDENNAENVLSYERACKERMARNEEYMSSLGLGNKEKLASRESQRNGQKTQNEKKQKASKGTLSIARRSLRLGGPADGEDADNTNDQLPNISHDDDADIAEEMVYFVSEKGLRDFYFKLKNRFEGTSEQVGEIASSTPDVANKEPIMPSTAKEKTPILSTNMTDFSTSPSLDLAEDISAFKQKRKITQGMYRSIEREAKSRKLEGKKAYLIEVKDGESVGPNASRWASELGTRVRSHMDVTKGNFADQDERNVDIVIQQMENAFESFGGRISIKYYKKKMRKLINNYRHKCRKSILDGKDRDSSLTPKQWEELKESMRTEEYVQKSTKGKIARDNVRDPFIFGRGGRRGNQNMFVQGAGRSELDDGEMIDRVFADLGNSKKKHISRIPISRSLPSNDFEKSLTTSTSVENNGESYKHIMECISGLTKTVSTIATSIEPIVASWKNRGCPSDSDEDKIKGSPNIDVPHRSQPVTTLAIRISNVDLCQLIPPEHVEFHVSDKVDILDPYDGAIAGTGRIQSLAMIHGVPLSPEDANINVIDVTSNIPVAYEDTIDGCQRMKETVKSFIRWPKKYLRKSSI